MTFLANATPSSGAEALYNLKATACVGTMGANWTVPYSSNGIVYAAQGDVILSAASLTTSGAWFVLQGVAFQDIGVPYHTQLCIQTNGTTGLRIKISFRAGFTGGTPSFSRVPSATDEVVLWGGGTDASPTYTPFFAASGQRQQGWCNEGDETLYFLEYPVGGGACSALLMIDRPQPNPMGLGGNLLDKERITFYMATGASAALCASVSGEATAPMSMFLYGATAQLWGRCPPAMSWVYDSSAVPQKVIPGGCATSPIYAEPVVPELALAYVRRAALAGVALAGEVGDVNTCDSKGTSVYFRYGGQTKAVPVLLDSVNPLTGNIETGSVLALGDLLLPWNSTALAL